MTVVEVYEDLVILCEAACDKRVHEYLIRHCKVIKPKHLIDLDIHQIDLQNIPLLLAEHPEPELPIVDVH